MAVTNPKLPRVRIGEPGFKINPQLNQHFLQPSVVTTTVESQIQENNEIVS